ncbi:MAG: nucleotide exchange factor GrpE [Candidatus Phytoplasma stylosanthis]|uniref:nucleotide exchange factor GrpE n=1 Tax=Candidatus Phytoplasma stylosanthis TaxID=2798314 RepID=UPI00293B73CB|nr:nucleotide exchange factor GrpE [Candidatus Phytoplasma stylosanthis]MDV3167887.1 nucleotide exchange factor GrpE [Candidatus Phytoplasma stylosanthis]MDV3170722.1 nucleotide exchange factor GrpE [Candidatus Phytoplasma stylosanthis]MDV3173739.1 nucleotide exchange factor GrpE [Candidatus Phytoplasma stylosanthis]MDV3173979.1 nucleotide exchange factor GrpE [Candidatus Phytoplasma stylosanthis]MDV3202647.1 nucleotide exchange factor GrpE [Candidatus Phytoplasma stylosanthis]
MEKETKKQKNNLCDHSEEENKNKKTNNIDDNKLEDQNQEKKSNFSSSNSNEEKEDISETENKKEEKEHKKDISEIENENKQLQKDLEQIKQNWLNDKLRYQANLDNFQKRIKKENDNYLKYSSMNLISNLLEPLEKLEQVLETNYEEPLLKNFLSGFRMINKQIKEVLNKEGVEEIKALREKFDPKIHYALEKTSNKDEPNGINIAVLQKGYLYKDLIIKPAMVKVNEWSDKKNENK